MIAHAGGEGLGPANTLLAMHRSMMVGADMLEADLWMSADGVIVASHDRDVAKETDGHGAIDSLTWSHIQTLDTRAGWAGPPIDEPIRIPSLEQILAEFPHVPFALDLKHTTPMMATSLCAILRRTPVARPVLVTSRFPEALDDVRAHCADAVVTVAPYAEPGQAFTTPTTGQDRCAPDPIAQGPHRPGGFGFEAMRWWHERGLAVYTWTVDDPDTLRLLANAGVDGVYTRRPDIARQVFDTSG